MANRRGHTPARGARERGAASPHPHKNAVRHDRVAAASQMLENAGAAAELLKALANPHRLRVLCLLAQGEMSVGRINEAVDLSQSALSQHLAVLRENELVAVRRHSQTMNYSLAPGPVHDLIDVLHRAYCTASCGPATPRAGRRNRSGNRA
jgi:DNA-binding transcriptional ArsR family regulator